MAHDYTREFTLQPTPIDTERLRRLDILPDGLAGALDTYDKAWEDFAEADSEREEAEAAILDAERNDGIALKTALIAGKGDPGTKATDAAHRAAIVAQTKLQIVREALDASSTTIWRLVKAHPAMLGAAARVELEHLEGYAKLADEAFGAIDRMMTAAREIGLTYDTVNGFVGYVTAAARLNPNWPDMRDSTYSGQSVADWYRTRLVQLAAEDAQAARSYLGKTASR